MFKNKKFGIQAIIILVITFCMFAMQATLTTGQLNAISPYLINTFGWSESAIALPTTIGGYIMIPGYFLVGWLLMKFGVRKITIPSGLLCALGGVMVAICDGSYILYSIGIALLYVFSVPMMLAAQKLLCEWFIRYRGRALGFATIGAPFAAAFLLTPLANMINGSGLRLAYFVVAAIAFAIALYTLIFIKDRPEDRGLHPDGADTAPQSDEISERISAKELFSQKNTWKVIVAFGFLNLIICASGAYLILRFMSVGGTQADGLRAMTIGSLLGIPISYIFGIIDDKLGSIKASIIMGITFLIHLVPLAIMKSPSWPVIITAAFGMACMTGGLPTIDPAIISYVWGHKRFQAVKTMLQPLLGLFSSSAVAFMAVFSTAGHLTLAFYALIAMAVISIIILCTMLKVPDADSADRDYSVSSSKNSSAC